MMRSHAVTKRFFVLMTALLLTLGGFFATGARAQTPSTPLPTPEADALFKAQKWDEAAKAYQEATRQHPENGRAWFLLGNSYHSLGKYEWALEPFQKAIAINKNPIAMYNLACAYARLNNKDKAFEWLNQSVKAGFAQMATLDSDNDLDGLRADARFQEVKANLTKTLTPCMVTPEHRQFDFWVGEWNVLTPQGQVAGTSSIQRVVDGCVIFENWTGAGGGNGKSFNYYDKSDGKWHQLWVGNGGGVIQFTGEYKDDMMRIEGEQITPQGVKARQRMTFSKLEGGKVRQLWETSTDGGKTWSTSFDGTYVKKS